LNNIPPSAATTKASTARRVYFFHNYRQNELVW